MQRQALPAVNVSPQSPATTTTQMIPARFIDISNSPSETFIQSIYNLQGAINIAFNDTQLQDFTKYFCSEKFHLSKLTLYALSLNKLSLKIVELIISTLLSKPNPELKFIVIDNLDESSLRVIYDFVLYFTHKGQLLTVLPSGPNIPQNWLMMFHELHHPQNLANAISTEFLLLMKARFSDRNRYTLQLTELDNTLRQTQAENLSLTSRLQSKTRDYDELTLKAQSVTLYSQALEKQIQARDVVALVQLKALQEQLAQQRIAKADAEAKEAGLLAQLKSLQDQIQAQEIEKQNLIKAAADKEEKLQGKLSRLKMRANLLEQSVAKIDEQFPALLPMNLVLRTVTPDDLLQIQNQPICRKKTTSSESKEESSSEEKFHRRSEQRSPLKDKLKSQITDWMVNGQFASKLHPSIHQYIRQQLEIAEVIIANGNSFYHIPDGKAECIFHYLAFIICNIPKAPRPYDDHQYERKVLLQTLANAFQMIEDLHKAFVSRLGTNKIEMNNLKSEIEKIINQLLTISHPAVTEVTTSAVRQLQTYGLFNANTSRNISLSSSSSPSPSPSSRPDIVVPHL